MDINYSLIISVVAGLATFLWTVYQYRDSRRRDQDLKEFENFHKLIKELVQPQEGVLYVDRQTAILFELRHFKRYYSFSYRTLIGLKEKWEKVPDQFPRLLEELNMTIDFLNNKLKK